MKMNTEDPGLLQHPHNDLLQYTEFLHLFWSFKLSNELDEHSF